MPVPYTGGRTLRKINAFTQGVLIELMLDGVYTTDELADRTGLSFQTVRNYCRELHRAKACHICGWELDKKNNFTLRLYKIGRGKDTPRPRMTAAQRQARSRAARKLIEHQHTIMFNTENASCPADPFFSPKPLAGTTDSPESPPFSST